MAQIKLCTDLEQSRKLVEEILPPESADMLILNNVGKSGKVDGTNCTTILKENLNPLAEVPEILSCWSIASLLEILDYPQLSKDKLGSGKVGWMVSVYPNDCRYDSYWHDNPIDACYEIIIKLHDLNLL